MVQTVKEILRKVTIFYDNLFIYIQRFIQCLLKKFSWTFTFQWDLFPHAVFFPGHILIFVLESFSWIRIHFIVGFCILKWIFFFLVHYFFLISWFFQISQYLKVNLIFNLSFSKFSTICENPEICGVKNHSANLLWVYLKLSAFR